MHQTNKAFERYFKIEGNDVRNIYNKASQTTLFVATHSKKVTKN